MTPDDEPDADRRRRTREETSTDDEGVEAEGTLLEQSQATIDDAHEAVKRVAATDAIGEDTIGAGDLPPSQTAPMASRSPTRRRRRGLSRPPHNSRISREP